MERGMRGRGAVSRRAEEPFGTAARALGALPPVSVRSVQVCARTHRHPCLRAPVCPCMCPRVHRVPACGCACRRGEGEKGGPGEPHKHGRQLRLHFVTQPPLQHASLDSTSGEEVGLGPLRRRPGQPGFCRGAALSPLPLLRCECRISGHIPPPGPGDRPPPPTHTLPRPNLVPAEVGGAPCQVLQPFLRACGLGLSRAHFPRNLLRNGGGGGGVSCSSSLPSGLRAAGQADRPMLLPGAGGECAMGCESWGCQG